MKMDTNEIKTSIQTQVNTIKDIWGDNRNTIQSKVFQVMVGANSVLIHMGKLATYDIDTLEVSIN